MVHKDGLNLAVPLIGTHLLIFGEQLIVIQIKTQIKAQIVPPTVQKWNKMSPFQCTLVAVCASLKIRPSPILVVQTENIFEKPRVLFVPKISCLCYDIWLFLDWII